MIKSKRLRSALYVRNSASIIIQDHLDTVHNARQVGKSNAFCVQKLDGFTLLIRRPLVLVQS